MLLLVVIYTREERGKESYLILFFVVVHTLIITVLHVFREGRKELKSSFSLRVPATYYTH